MMDGFPDRGAIARANRCGYRACNTILERYGVVSSLGFVAGASGSLGGAQSRGCKSVLGQC
jgi:hypothetical protein